MRQPLLLGLLGLAVGVPGTVRADHLSGGFSMTQSSAINTESALPLAPGEWHFGLQYEQRENTGLDDATLIGLRAFDIVAHGEAHADLHSIERVSGTSLSAAYGLTEDLTLGIRIPWVKRENIREPEEGHSHDGNPIVIHNVIEHGTAAGLGDITLQGLYHFMAAESYDLSLLFGLQLPTGVDDEKGFKNEVFVRRVDTGVIPDEHGHDEGGHSHSGTLLETHQQPGGGAWNPILGFAYSRILGPVNLDGSLLYTFTNEGDQDTNLGDRLQYNLGLAWPVGESLDLVLELNGEWQDHETRGSDVIENSGGSYLLLAPGVRYSGDAWNVSLSYGVPVAERLNGYQSEPDARYLANLSFNF